VPCTLQFAAGLPANGRITGHLHAHMALLTGTAYVAMVPHGLVREPLLAACTAGSEKKSESQYPHCLIHLVTTFVPSVPVTSTE